MANITKFIVKGPFLVPTKEQKRGGRTIDDDKLKQLLDEEATFDKPGCYVFSMGSKPLYVGQTGKMKIAKEAFSDRNRNLMCKIINNVHGTLKIWTVTRGRDERGPWPTKKIKYIEKELTELASIKNPDVVNIHNIRRKRRWSIEGVIQAERGRRSKEATAFRKMIGLAV